MALTPFLVNPVLMEPTSAPLKGFLGGEAGSGGFSPQYAPFLFDGNLYQVLQAAGPVPASFSPSGGIFVYQSVNQGASWASLDTANGPTRTDLTPGAGFFYDSAQTIIVAWTPDAGPLVGHHGALNLKNFNLNAGTWGATYGTAGAPLVWTVAQAYQRPDGSILVLATPNFAAGAVNGCTAYVFAAGAWSSFAVDTNLPGGFLSTGNISSCMDSTGRIHVVMLADNGVTREWCYQLVNTNNTLGTSAVLQVGAPNLPGAAAAVQPNISGNNFVFGIVSDNGLYPSIIVGTPLSAPVFTTLGSPGIDPNLPAGFLRLSAPAIAVDATGLYASYLIQQNNNVFLIRTAFNPNVNTPLMGWSQSIQAFDAATSATGDATDWQFLGIRRDSGNLFGSANTTQGGSGQPTQFWLGVFAPGAVTLPPLSAGGAGTPPPNRMCCPADAFDLAQMLRENRLKHGEAWPFIHQFAPPSSIPVNEIGNPVALGALNATVVTFTYRVPSGLRLMLHAIIQNADNFLVPGDILWTLDLNTPPGIADTQAQGVQGLTSIPFPLGSLQNGRPWYFRRAYEFEPLSVLRCRAQNIAAVPGMPMVSGLFGFLVPARK